MNKFNRFNIYTGLFLFVAALVLTSSLYAESVFLKDGSIVEGKIVNEDDNGVEVNLSTGEVQKILRINIIRTLYHDRYKEKKIINKSDGTKIEAYIIDEDSNFYTYRTDLASVEEKTISKDDVDSISRIKTGKPADKENDSETSVSYTGYYLRGIIPGWGQFYSGHELKGSILAVAFIGDAVWTGLAFMQYKRSKDKYDGLEAGLSNEEYDSAYKKYKDDGNTAKYLSISLGAIYALNWIDILFFSGPEPARSAGMFYIDDVCVNPAINVLNENNMPDIRMDFSFSMSF